MLKLLFAPLLLAAQENPNKHSALKAEFSRCTVDYMISELRDATHYASCADGDLNCYRQVGVRVAQACLVVDLFACNGSVAPLGPAKLQDVSDCLQDRRSFSDEMVSAILAELPPLQDIRRLDEIGFTEERRLVQQLGDFDRHAWPADCGRFPSETLTISDESCANMFWAGRLELVSGIAALLHGAAGAF